VTHPGQPTTTRTVTVRGVSTNVLQFNSVYLLNASKLDKITYNSFYTTLLGAPYGDVTTPHYLAGELLFQS
jgi:hypothetical protein